MKYWPIYIIFFILLSFSCRKKIAEDYIYYQPYRRDTASSKIATPKTLSIDSVQSNKTEVIEITPVDLQDKYLIVIASFSNEDYAKTTKNDLIKQGYKPEIFMLNNDGWHKLAISSSNNFDEATSAINKIKLKGGLFSGARIVIK